MQQSIIRFLFIILVLFQSCGTVENVSDIYRGPASTRSCNDLLDEILEREHSLAVEARTFTKHYKALNRTLSGNLATVFRSEWKAKENTEATARYLNDLLESFSPELKKKIRLTPSSGEGFFKEVIEQIKKQQSSNVGMRDPPPPKGATDKTFTYYTKSINDSNGGNHQVRLRRYIRSLDLDQIEVGTPIRGFLDGKIHEVQKVSKNRFKLVTATGVNKETGDLTGVTEEITVAKSTLMKRFGSPPMFYSFPHAKKYKLEVKSRPHEAIGTGEFEKIDGQNYVQKLNVNLDDSEVRLLFGEEFADVPSMERLKQLEELAAKDPKITKERSKAIFDVLRLGLEKDKDFLSTRGSTEYRRYAFEIELPDEIDGKRVRVQTTFDTEMGTRSNYSPDGKFLSPIESIRGNQLLDPKNSEEQFHIELKVPKELIERVERGEGSPELRKLLEIFNSYRVTNKGKFNHIQFQRDIDE